MPESTQPTKKALQEELKRVQAALKKVDTTPRYPSVRRKCKYCKLEFNTPATYNGQQMKFCKPAHRKAFDKEGEKPIDVILRKQEKRMREIVREEIRAANTIQVCRELIENLEMRVIELSRERPVGIVPPIRISNRPAEDHIAK